MTHIDPQEELRDARLAIKACLIVARKTAKPMNLIVKDVEYWLDIILTQANRESRILGASLVLSDIEAEIELNGYEAVPEFIVKLRKLTRKAQAKLGGK